MPFLSGLPGTTGVVKCRMVWSVRGAKMALRSGVAATAAGNNGALNVWRGNDGAYLCEAYYRRSTVASAKFSAWSDVVKWLKQWFKEIA